MRRVQQRGGTLHVSTPASRMTMRGRALRGHSIPAPVLRIDTRVPAEQERDAVTELDSMQPARRQTTTEVEVPADVRAQGVSARRAWLRERLAHRQARDYQQRADEGLVAEASRPFWRRVAGRVFPSL